MHFKALIDAVVRQTTVLIAHLATAAGVRAPLSHLVNQVFLDLVTELEAQGLGRKVVADMFGIALRSYQLKVRRLSESSTDRDRTLWEATLTFVQGEGPVSRARVLQRMRYDDDALVRAVLHDLVESGLVYKTGRGDGTVYRAADPEELGDAFQANQRDTAAHFVWIQVYRAGPVTLEWLIRETRLESEVLERALGDLVDDGRVERHDVAEATTWRCPTCVLPTGTTVGWEAALFDHFQAVVSAMCLKLGAGQARSLPSDLVGGSTWSFDVWEGHPHREEVTGLLRELRDRVSKLRTEVTLFNDHHGRPDTAQQVTVYLGQAVTGLDATPSIGKGDADTSEPLDRDRAG